MNCIIIEDEAVAARRLKKLVEEQGVEVVALLHSVQESIAWFRAYKAPNLIFLDIQLGDGLSFEIFEEVQPKSSIIFTTAYDEYALRAFKVNSLDYLLKPIQENELIKALKKYDTLLSEMKDINIENLKYLLKIDISSKQKERFLIKIGQRIKTIDTKDISLFFSENKGTYLCKKKRNYLVDYTLDELNTLLNPKKFYRISRNAIIHLDYIQEIHKYSGSRLKIKMLNNNKEWLVSRERVNSFMSWLEE